VGTNRKANNAGGRSLVNETINVDGHCRRRLERVVEADARPKTEVNRGTLINGILSVLR